MFFGWLHRGSEPVTISKIKPLFDQCNIQFSATVCVLRKNLHSEVYEEYKISTSLGVFSIIKSPPIGLFFYVSIPTNMDLPFLGSISDLEIVNSTLPLCNHSNNIPQSYLLCSPAAGWHYFLGQHVALTCLFVSNLMVTV